MRQRRGFDIQIKKIFIVLICSIFYSCAISKYEKFEERQFSYSRQAEKYKRLYMDCKITKCDSLLWWAANSQFKSEEFSCSLSVKKEASNECRHLGSRPYFWELKKKYPESRYALPTFIRIGYIEDLNGEYGIANQILIEFITRWPNHEMTRYAREQMEIYRKRKIGKQTP